MIDGAIVLISLLGFALLLLVNPRHQQDWLRRKLAPKTGRTLRMSGLVLLALAFGVSGMGYGWGHGAVVWLGWLTIAAALVVVAHTNRERIIARIWR